MSRPASDAASPEVVCLTRVIGAPPGEVYLAFLDAGRVRQWFSPEGFCVLEADIDPRPGGRYHVAITSGRGARGRVDCLITHLVPGEVIVMTWSWTAEGPVPADIPQDGSALTIALREAGPGTAELTLVHDRPSGAPGQGPDGIAAWWDEVLARLAACFPAAPAPGAPG